MIDKMNDADKEKLLQLAVKHGEPVEQTYRRDMFVTYRNHRVFFNWHPEHNQWFFSANRTGEDAARDLGSAWLGGECFSSWDAWSEYSLGQAVD